MPRLEKGKASFEEFYLLTGPERLQFVLFFLAEVPDDEWQRRKDFHDKLDHMMHKAVGVKNGRWISDADCDVQMPGL
jgi:hypothetical protein